MCPVLDTGGGGFSNRGGKPVFVCDGREALVSMFVLAVVALALRFGTMPAPGENVIAPSTGRL